MANICSLACKFIWKIWHESTRMHMVSNRHTLRFHWHRHSLFSSDTHLIRIRHLHTQYTTHTHRHTETVRIPEVIQGWVHQAEKYLQLAEVQNSTPWTERRLSNGVCSTIHGVLQVVLGYCATPEQPASKQSLGHDLNSSGERISYTLHQAFCTVPRLLIITFEKFPEDLRIFDACLLWKVYIDYRTRLATTLSIVLRHDRTICIVEPSLLELALPCHLLLSILTILEWKFSAGYVTG